MLDIKFFCLITSAEYIENNFHDILKYESIVEKRITIASVSKRDLINDNEWNLQLCIEYGLPYILIDDIYDIEVAL